MLSVDIGGGKPAYARIKKKKKFPYYKPDKKYNWKVLDIEKKSDYVHDLLSGEPLPFKNDSIDNFFMSHTLEHLEADSIPFVLKEIYRSLKSGGILKVAVPDFAWAVRTYVKNPKKLMNDVYPFKRLFIPETPMGYLTSWIYDFDPEGIGHKIGFDDELLLYYLKQAGFSKIQKFKWGEGSPAFDNMENPRFKGWSIHMEATK
jgi:predicted SAM-dependent methyltransferase